MPFSLETLVLSIYKNVWCVTPDCPVCSNEAVLKALKSYYDLNREEYVTALSEAFTDGFMYHSIWPMVLELTLCPIENEDDIERIVACWEITCPGGMGYNSLKR